jgi:hypothetical protein
LSNDFYTSKASNQLKVVLFHLWPVKAKTIPGFIHIPLADFFIDKLALKYCNEWYEYYR